MNVSVQKQVFVNSYTCDQCGWVSVKKYPHFDKCSHCFKTFRPTLEEFRKLLQKKFPEQTQITDFLQYKIAISQ